MIVVIGVIASILFNLGIAAQTVKSYRDGYADVSHGFVWYLLSGFILMSYYTINKLGWDWVLLGTYAFQFVCVATTGYYKYFPRLAKERLNESI